MSIEEGLFEILKSSVIEVELPLERAVRYPPLALEHRDRLGEEILKGHDRTSTTLALVPQERSVRQGGVSLESARRVYQK
jgi:hypothetical protein